MPGQNTLPRQAPDAISYVVPLRGLNTEDPGRTAPIGSAVTADNIWLYRGTVQPGLEKTFFKSISGSTAQGRWLGQLSVLSGGSYTRHELTVHLIAGVQALTEIDGGVPTDRGDLNGTYWPDAVQVGNRLIIVSGGAPQVWDGTANDLQDLFQAPGVAPTLNADAEDNEGNNLVPGNYIFGFTFSDPVNGDETSLSATVTHTFIGAAGDDTAKLDFAANVPEARFTDINLYRTTVNGGTLFLDTTVVWVVGGLTDIAIGISTDSNLKIQAPQDNDAPPDAKGVTAWDGRVWYYAEDASSTSVWYSKVGQPGAVPDGTNDIGTSNELIPIDQEDGSGITNVSVYDSRLYAFKEETAYLIGPHPSTTYSTKKIDMSFGCRNPQATALANNLLFGFMRGRLWSFNGSRFTEISSEWATTAQTISQLQMDTDDDPIWLTYDRATDRRRLMFNSTFDAGSTPKNFYCTLDGQLTAHIPNSDIAHLIEAFPQDSGEPTIFGMEIDPAGGGLDLNKFFTTTDTESAVYQTGLIDPDPQSAFKMFHDFDILVGPGVGADDTFTVETQGVVQTIPALGSDVDKRHHFRFPNKTPAETIDFKFTWATADSQRVLAIRIWYKPVGEMAPT